MTVAVTDAAALYRAAGKLLATGAFAVLEFGGVGEGVPNYVTSLLFYRSFFLIWVMISG